VWIGVEERESSRGSNNKCNWGNLSPWIHFGVSQISAQRCVLEVRRYSKQLSKSVEAYVEEAVVRRELSDNYCFSQKNYDKLDGAYEWARKTLEDHRQGNTGGRKTHDELWNSAQIQLVTEGKMHGFFRMYWAKKILEWMKSPDDSLATANYLKDKYSLMGEIHGYVGCMWSICGIHDQGWGERQVFGKIRYMKF
ncbi:LOW QUALITY PROTEIN: deoxyribodipyrimidine photo-lyase-like, partial [Penaeus monodon]|uniref:LOW QUALITY PROTEIN: deoxyribodipyrimidine photo-lyase-like n=1 Tax=Penaeus monodon TaxID=6687 RepID=UPI0018A6E39C